MSVQFIKLIMNIKTSGKNSILLEGNQKDYILAFEKEVSASDKVNLIDFTNKEGWLIPGEYEDRGLSIYSLELREVLTGESNLLIVSVDGIAIALPISTDVDYKKIPEEIGDVNVLIINQSFDREYIMESVKQIDPFFIVLIDGVIPTDLLSATTHEITSKVKITQEDVNASIGGAKYWLLK